METRAFSALGTKWSIVVDQESFPEMHSEAILEEVHLFENRFSRFLPTSEVNQFRQASPGTYEVSRIFSVLLHRAVLLRECTGGSYDPAVGGLLECAGYGMKSEREKAGSPEAFRLPQWSVRGTLLSLDGPTAFDFGGIGKGYCIDLVASTLQRLGYQYFLVEGGGDMYGTTKRDGRPFRVALEYPGLTDTAFGVVELSHQAVAVSDSFKRRWQKWHHIIDPHTRQPVHEVVGCAALSQNAFSADSMTSGLFLAPSRQYPRLQDELSGEYVVFFEGGAVQVSPRWPGELFV